MNFTVSSSVPGDTAVDQLNDHEDKIESKLAGVKYDNDVYNEILYSTIEDAFEHDIVEMAQYMHPIGSEEWKQEISKRFLSWTEYCKEKAQEIAEDIALNE